MADVLIHAPQDGGTAKGAISGQTTTLEDSARQAEQLESEAKAGSDAGTYTHTFAKPFTYEGRTYEKLTFDWSNLSGKDSVEIERGLLRRGITTVIAEYTPEYLASMAARCCTHRSEEGFRIVSMDTLYALPLPEFRAICGAARRFLMRAG